MSNMPTLSITNVGQIKTASIKFGDLTVFVGQQATGKSIALQLLKLAIDAGQVQREMRRYGLDWSGQLSDFLNSYFGEGMNAIWKETSGVRWQGNDLDLQQMAKRKRKAKEEMLFYIPAQRVLTLRDGWPRPFTDYSPGDPFAVREFSEQLRVLVDKELGSSSLFPQARRLKREFRELLERDVFSEYALKIDRVRSQKRLVLGTDTDGGNLPYMVWSAGQREFVPLLLGFYWLMPPTKASRRGHIEWVVLEELEVGLHPRAISVVLLLVFELAVRGYRVCLSTHSSQVLDALWAMKHLSENGANAKAFLEIFGAPKTPPMLRLAKGMMSKIRTVYYFDKESGTVHDISALEPGAEESGQSGWGGLSEFSGRASGAVAQAIANAIPKAEP
jgi:hypothetical protein